MESLAPQEAAAVPAVKKAPHVIIVGAGKLPFYTVFTRAFFRHFFMLIITSSNFLPHHRLHWPPTRPGSQEGKLNHQTEDKSVHPITTLTSHLSVLPSLY